MLQRRRCKAEANRIGGRQGIDFRQWRSPPPGFRQAMLHDLSGAGERCVIGTSYVLSCPIPQRTLLREDQMPEAVIVATARTPIGRAYRGAFNDTQGQTLAGHVVAAAVRRAGIDPTEVED